MVGVAVGVWRWARLAAEIDAGEPRQLMQEGARVGRHLGLGAGMTSWHWDSAGTTATQPRSRLLACGESLEMRTF